MSYMISRRHALCVAAALAALPLSARAARLDRLSLHGPPAGPSITLIHAIASGRLAGLAPAAEFTAWRNPDELRAGLTSGIIALSVVPVQAAANLHNRGFPIRLANVMTDGLLYVLSDSSELRSVEDLAGQRVAVPYRGDLPALMFDQLLGHFGLNSSKDLQVTFTGSPTEAMQLLLAGRVNAALTSEPSTTAGLLRARQQQRELYRAIDLQAAWGEATGASPVLPQAGLAVTEGFLDEQAALLPRLLEALEAATASVLAEPEVAAAQATEALGLPAPLLAASIPHANLVARQSISARVDIERMLVAVAGDDFRRIGGRLPGDDFYL